MADEHLHAHDPHANPDPDGDSPLQAAIRQHMSAPHATNIAFMQVWAELCEFTGQVPAQAGGQDPFEPIAFEATIAGVDMRVSCVPGEVAGVFLACMFGPLPEPGALEAAVRLLELNLFLHTHGRSAFCIDPDSGDVVCGCRLDVSTLSAASLFEAMSLLSEQALRWRTNGYLDPVPARHPLRGGVFA